MIQKQLEKVKNRAGWTRADFRKRLEKETGLHVSLRTISRWENGKGVQKTYRQAVKSFLDKVESEL